jgi:hypothetical protein
VFENDQIRPDAALGDLASLAIRKGAWSKSASLWHPVQWSHLPTDPRELSATAATAVPPDIREDIERAWQGAVSLALETPEDVDTKTRAALEALGYIDPSDE